MVFSPPHKMLASDFWHHAAGVDLPCPADRIALLFPAGGLVDGGFGKNAGLPTDGLAGHGVFGKSGVAPLLAGGGLGNHPAQPVGAMAAMPLRMKLRGADIHAAHVLLPPDGRDEIHDMAALLGDCLGRAAKHGDVMAFAEAENNPLLDDQWNTVFCTEAAQARAHVVDLPPLHDLTPALVPQWHRFRQWRFQPFDAAFSASQPTLLAQLERFCARPDHLALCARDGRQLSGVWFGRVVREQADTLQAFGDDPFWFALVSGLARRGAKRVRLRLPPETGLRIGQDVVSVPQTAGRVINLAKLITALPSGSPESAHIFVQDPLFAHNHGLWRISGKQAMCEAQRVPRSGDISPAVATAGELAQWILGNPMALHGNTTQCLTLARILPPITPMTWLAP